MGGLSSFFSGTKGTTLTQEEMLTPEQKAALQALLGYSQTGKSGAYDAGADYTGALGDYNMTGAEQAGQSKILQMLQSGGPEIFNMGKQTITDLLSTDKFDPYNEKGVYSGFKKNVLRDQQDTSDAMKRNMAVTGDLYSTENARQHGLLAERTGDQLTNKLAELYDTFAQRKLAGAETAANMGVAEQGMLQNNMTLAGLERQLNDQKAKDAYSEWNRKQTSLADTVQAARDIFNRNVNYGVKSYTTASSASPFSKLLNTGLSAAASTLGGGVGNIALGWMSGAGKELGANYDTEDSSWIKSFLN